jgi:hypothetical protein
MERFTGPDAVIGLVPRATQRVTTVAGCGGRPYWVHDPAFDLGAIVA